MNVVDSSAWLEYFADGPNAEDFAPAIMDAASLLVPSITVFEVFKRIRQQRDSEVALRAVSQMRRGHVVDLGADLAIAAADLSERKSCCVIVGLLVISLLVAFAPCAATFTVAAPASTADKRQRCIHGQRDGARHTQSCQRWWRPMRAGR